MSKYIVYMYYTKTDDRWYTSYYGQMLRFGSTRLMLYLIPSHVLSIVIYFQVDYELILSQIMEIFKKCRLKTTSLA